MTRITGTLREDLCTFITISRSIPLRIGNVPHKCCRENTYFTFDNFFSPQVCRLRDNVEKYSTTSQATDDNKRKRLPCWITKDKDKQSQYVILVAFPWPQWFHERASMFRLYVHCLSCCRVSMILFYSLHSLLVHGFIALVYHYHHHHHHHHHHRWCTGGYV